MKMAKKSKGPSLPLDLISSPNKVPIAKVEAKDGMPLDMAGATLTSTGKAPREKERGRASSPYKGLGRGWWGSDTSQGGSGMSD